MVMTLRQEAQQETEVDLFRLGYDKGKDDAERRAKARIDQEPVAWWHRKSDTFTSGFLVNCFSEWTPLYTAPQPHREVELTDDAITHMAAQSLLYEENPPQGFDAAVRSFARAVIEAYKAKQGEQT